MTGEERVKPNGEEEEDGEEEEEEEEEEEGALDVDSDPVKELADDPNVETDSDEVRGMLTNNANTDTDNSRHEHGDGNIKSPVG
jgi:hypothetical protein